MNTRKKELIKEIEQISLSKKIINDLYDKDIFKRKQELLEIMTDVRVGDHIRTSIERFWQGKLIDEYLVTSVHFISFPSFTVGFYADAMVDGKRKRGSKYDFNEKSVELVRKKKPKN